MADIRITCCICKLYCWKLSEKSFLMTKLSKILVWAGSAVLLVVDRLYACYIGRISGKAFGEACTSSGPIIGVIAAEFEAVEIYLQSHEKSLMVAGTLAVALFTWTLYKTARDQLFASHAALEIAERSARITEQTLVASQRPWLSVEVGLAGPLIITDEEVRVEIGFTVKNVGKSPALNMQVEPLLMSIMHRTQDDHPMAKTQKLSEEIKSRPLAENSITGNTIFPDEISRQVINLGIRIEDLKNSAPEGVELDTFGLELAGYVSYRTAFNDGIHLSHFCGTLAKHQPDRPHLRMLFKYSEKRLEPGQYGIWADPFFGGRVD